MEILAIHLAPTVVHLIRQSPQPKLYLARSFDQALNALTSQDFQWIIEDLRQSTNGPRDLATLLAYTSIGTQILALCHPGEVLDRQYWLDQGVQLFIGRDDQKLASQIFQQLSISISQ